MSTVPSPPLDLRTGPDGRPERPAGITVLAILDLLAAFALLTGGLVCLALGREQSSGGLAAAGTLLLLSAAVHVLAAFGLFKLRAWGRWAQLALAVVGLAFFCAGTMLGLAVLVYLLLPGMALAFSGRRADEMTDDERRALAAATGSKASTFFIAAIAAILLFGVAMQGIVAAIAIPNLLNAIQRGKQKRTMADIRSIATALEARATDVNAYPATDSLDDLARALEPTYIKVMPRNDGWNRPLVVAIHDSQYVILSQGKDGRPDLADPWSYAAGSTASFDEDIVFSNGVFVRSPNVP